MVANSQFFDAVFFDMDGLMVDSEPEWFKSETEVTARFHYPWSEEDRIACLGGVSQNYRSCLAISLHRSSCYVLGRYF